MYQTVFKKWWPNFANLKIFISISIYIQTLRILKLCSHSISAWSHTYERCRPVTSTGLRQWRFEHMKKKFSSTVQQSVDTHACKPRLISTCTTGQTICKCMTHTSKTLLAKILSIECTSSWIVLLAHSWIPQMHYLVKWCGSCLQLLLLCRLAVSRICPQLLFGLVSSLLHRLSQAFTLDPDFCRIFVILKFDDSNFRMCQRGPFG